MIDRVSQWSSNRIGLYLPELLAERRLLADPCRDLRPSGLRMPVVLPAVFGGRRSSVLSLPSSSAAERNNGRNTEYEESLFGGIVFLFFIHNPNLQSEGLWFKSLTGACTPR